MPRLLGSSHLALQLYSQSQSATRQIRWSRQRVSVTLESGVLASEEVAR